MSKSGAVVKRALREITQRTHKDRGSKVGIRTILEWPHKILETKASEVTTFDSELEQLVNDMHLTMKHSNGIGLAANQIGVLLRVLTIEIPFGEERQRDPEEKQEPWHNKKYTFINPVITKKQGKTTYQEGCLSFPEIFDFVDRSAEIEVSAVDERGKPFTVEANGLFAVCLQHEIDHLDGIVFINRMSRLKSNLIRKKILRRAPKQLEGIKS